MFGDLVSNAQASGEMNAIRYTQATKRQPKSGIVCMSTPVTWEGAPKVWGEVRTKTAGVIRFMRQPELPRGYHMEWHDSWTDAFNLLNDKEFIARASFDELDQLAVDIKALEVAIGKSADWVCPWEDRLDWCRWAGSFDDAWSDLLAQVEQGMEKAIKEALPYEPSSYDNPIGPRVQPPSYQEAMRQVVARLQAVIEAQHHDSR